MKPFPTTAPENCGRLGGYAGGPISPSQLACELFKENIPGPELACYMLRRFGWPNEWSDDYKNFMSWNLTTRIPGLYLCVTPHLAEKSGDKITWGDKQQYWQGNLHFGVRFTDGIGRQIEMNPGYERWQRRARREMLQWWRTDGVLKYSIGWCLAADPGEKLVHEIRRSKNDQDQEAIFGLWETRPEHAADGVSNDLAGWIKKHGTCVLSELADFRKKVLGHSNLPQMTPLERNCRKSRFARQAETALQETMLDLLRETYVRDINFNLFGRADLKVPPPATRPVIEVELDEDNCPKREPYWPGHGYPPSYYYSPAGIAARATAGQPRP